MILLCHKEEKQPNFMKCIAGDCADCGVKTVLNCTCDSIICPNRETASVRIWPKKESGIARGARVKRLCTAEIPDGAATVVVSIYRRRETDTDAKRTEL
jgi:hypothetical protein